MPVERHWRPKKATRTKDRGLERRNPERWAGRPWGRDGALGPSSPGHQPTCPSGAKVSPRGGDGHPDHPVISKTSVSKSYWFWASGGEATAAWHSCHSQGWKETQGSGICEDGDWRTPRVFCWDPREPTAFNLGKTEKEIIAKGHERCFRGGYFLRWSQEYLLYDTL